MFGALIETANDVTDCILLCYHRLNRDIADTEATRRTIEHKVYIGALLSLLQNLVMVWVEQTGLRSKYVLTKHFCTEHAQWGTI